jgi:hypothetical protein
MSARSDTGDEYCILCRHFQPDEPPGWEPSYDGREYDAHDALVAYRKSECKATLHGTCQLNPVHVDVDAWHACGQFVAGRTLAARRTSKVLVQEFLGLDWESQRLKHLTEENADLKKKLATSRKLSAQRLERLRGRKAEHDT